MISRRRCLAAIAALGAGAAGSRAGLGQTAVKPARIGLLSLGAGPGGSRLWDTLLAQLRDLGYVEGRDYVVEAKFLAGDRERIDDHAADLVRRNVGIIVVSGRRELEAARRATAAVPIVMTFVPDPLATGFVRSLGRPGGSVTGLTNVDYDLFGKRLEILKQAIPVLGKVAVLVNPANLSHAPTESWRPKLDDAARALRIGIEFASVTHSTLFDSAIAAAAAAGAGALMVPPDGGFVANRAQLAAAALAHRLPSMFSLSLHVEAGGLMSYAADASDLWRRAAFFVDKILKGADPALLPIELPIKFELAVNLRTARMLGLTLPASMVALADEVFE